MMRVQIANMLIREGRNNMEEIYEEENKSDSFDS